jgi:hypothetical protein
VTEAQAKVGESLLQTVQQTMTLVQQQSALLADYRMIVQRYEKLTSAMPQPPAVVHADAGRRTLWLNPRDGVIMLRKSWQNPHDHHWN